MKTDRQSEAETENNRETETDKQKEDTEDEDKATCHSVVGFFVFVMLFPLLTKISPCKKFGSSLTLK